MLAAVAGSCLTAIPRAESQVSVAIGVAPVCPYGYYDVAPYSCAPSGYYGPEWFSGDFLLGAGPWLRGADKFRGNVNNAYRPDHGHKGAMPNRGDQADPAQRVDKAHFTENEQRDGRGHTSDDKR
jgi:hypothetical protein